MYLLYVDESGDPGLHADPTRGSAIYVLLGLAVPDAEIRSLSQRVEEVLRRFLGGRAAQCELHRRLLLRGSPPFDRLRPEERRALDREIATVVMDSRATLLAVIIDKQAHQRRYQYPVRPDLLALEFLVERFDLFLSRRDDRGCVVYDSVGKGQDTELRRFFAGWQTAGTSARRIERIIETVFFVPSNTTRLVQLADCCAHIVFSHYSRPGGEPLLDTLRPRFDCSPTGEVEGWGIKRWSP